MIKLESVSFSYQSTPDFNSVDQLDLHIKKGEIVVLCGRSGCGKTTVTRLVNGLIPHFFEGELKGEVWVDGKDVAQTELSDFAKTCGSMFQNPKSQFFNIDTTSELAFGCENLALSPEEIHSRMESSIQKLELSHLKDRNIFQLSGGEKQQIAMGSIHAATPDLYVLDEPSSNMDAVAIERLRNLIITLKEEGKTVVISEHRLSYLLGIAHRFLYFSEGKLSEEFTSSQLLELTDAERENRGLRQLDLDKILYKKQATTSSRIGLQVEHLKCYKNKKQVLNVRQLSLPTEAVVAVIGGNGAGKSTFVESVTGLINTEGKVVIGGINLQSSERVRKSYIVMQDVNRQLFCPSVEEELSLNSTKSAEEIHTLLEQMDIARTKERHPASLSGGQKQRVAICTAFSSKKELMCYDEPTSGLDLTGMKNFCDLVSQTCNQHTLTLIITHDLELVLGCCTHVVHLEQGEVVDSYPVDDLGVEKLKYFFLHQKQSVKPKEKKEKQSVLKQLLSYNKSQKPIFWLGLALSGISSVLSLLPIFAVWLGVSELFEMYPNFTVTKQLQNYAFLAVGTAVATILVYGMALLCTHIVAFRIGTNLKKSVISRLLDLPLGYFDATGSGKIRRTLSETIGKTEGYLAHQMPDMIGAMVTPVAVICFGFYFNWQLGLLSLIPLVLAAYVMGLTMGDEVAESMAQYQSSLEEMNNEAVEFVRGISVIKTFGQSIFSLKKFHDTVLQYKEQVIGYTEFFRRPMVLFQTLLASVSSVLLISGLALFTNTQNLDKFFLDFLFFLFVTPLYGTMMMRLMWMSQNTQAAEDALNRISDLLDVEPLTYPKTCISPKGYDIKLENVSFSYPNSGKNALTKVNMELKTGETVALVGGSGGGKSTLAMLIPRFWERG